MSLKLEQQQSMHTSDASAPTQTCRRHPGVALEAVTFGANTHQFCPVCDAENERAADERRRADKEQRLAHGIPPRYRRADLCQFDQSNFCVRASQGDGYVEGGWPLLEKWVAQPQGFFYLYGGCGVGKTHLACAVKRAMNEAGCRASLSFANETFLSLRRSFGKKSGEREESEVIKSIAPDTLAANRGYVAIIDDLGNQKMSEYAVEVWTLIIDRLYRNSAAVLVTTNFRPSEISALLSDRIASRLASGPVVMLCGDDRRLKRHWTDDL